MTVESWIDAEEKVRRFDRQKLPRYWNYGLFLPTRKCVFFSMADTQLSSGRGISFPYEKKM